MRDSASTSSRCIHCSKEYDRNDLLKRHERRCNVNDRASRQKACQQCARTKSKCSYTQPSCHRCLSRQELCEYPKNATFGTTQETSSGWNDMGQPSGGKRLKSSSAQPPSVNRRDTANDPSAAPPFMPGMMDLSGLDWNSADYNVIDQEVWVGPDDMPSVPRSNEDGSGSSVVAAGSLAIQFAGNNVNLTQDSLLQHFSNQLQASERSSPEGPGNLPVLRDLHSSYNHVEVPSTTASRASVSMFPGLNLTSGASSFPRSMNAVLPQMQAHWTLTPPRSLLGLTSHKGGHISLREVVRDYAQLLQNDDFQSPFIHRELFHSSNQHLASMQRSTTAVCAAVALENKKSKQFAKRAITAERERLVNEFYSFSCVQELDALHAMCIYQITDLSDAHEDLTWKQGGNSCLLNLPFLLKMARQFTQSHSQDSSLDARAGDGTDVDWLTWLVQETVLRTTFLVHLINEASSTFRDGHAPYYERLAAESMADTPLPAPEPMWEAGNAEEWRRQKSSCQWAEDRSTARIMLGSEQWDLNRDLAPGVRNSRELYDLVIACAKLEMGMEV